MRRHPSGDRRLSLIEAKASRTVLPGDAASLDRLTRATAGYEVKRFVVHRATRTAAGHAIRPGTRAVGLEDLLAEI